MLLWNPVKSRNVILGMGKKQETFQANWALEKSVHDPWILFFLSKIHKGGCGSLFKHELISFRYWKGGLHFGDLDIRDFRIVGRNVA